MEHLYTYAALAAELKVWGSKSVAELVSRIGQAPKIRDIELAGELVSLEVSVRWTDTSREKITVEAVANGPSHWNLERMVERIIVPLRIDKAGRLEIPGSSSGHTGVE